MNVKENLQRNPSKRFKNTGCRFSLKIMLKKESSDARLELEYDHNHTVKALRALTIKDIPDHLRNMITDLFENGHTPRTAFKLIRKQVVERDGRWR